MASNKLKKVNNHPLHVYIAKEVKTIIGRFSILENLWMCPNFNIIIYFLQCHACVPGEGYTIVYFNNDMERVYGPIQRSFSLDCEVKITLLQQSPENCLVVHV